MSFVPRKSAITAASITEPHWLAGGFIVGAIFALGLFGAHEEQALAMALVVQIRSLLSVVAIGALTLWRMDVAIGKLQDRQERVNADR